MNLAIQQRCHADIHSGHPRAGAAPGGQPGERGDQPCPHLAQDLLQPGGGPGEDLLVRYSSTVTLPKTVMEVFIKAPILLTFMS